MLPYDNGFLRSGTYQTKHLAHVAVDDDHAEQQKAAEEGAAQADNIFGAVVGFEQQQHQSTTADKDANPRKAFENFSIH